MCVSLFHCLSPSSIILLPAHLIIIYLCMCLSVCFAFFLCLRLSGYLLTLLSAICVCVSLVSVCFTRFLCLQLSGCLLFLSSATSVSVHVSVSLFLSLSVSDNYPVACSAYHQLSVYVSVSLFHSLSLSYLAACCSYHYKSFFLSYR